MINYIKDCLYWIHLTFFKPLTLREILKDFKRKEIIKIFLRVYLFGAIIVFLIEISVGLICGFFDTSFNWREMFFSTLIVLVGGVFGGLFYSLFGDLFIGLFVGLFFGLFVGLSYGLFFDLFFGLFFGLGIGLVIGLFVGLFVNLFVDLFVGLFVGLYFGLFFGLSLGLDEGLGEVLNFFLVYTIVFLSSYLRPFYIFPHLLKYKRSLKDVFFSFNLFQNSPVYWDEAIALPLPYLSDWLVQLVKQDRKKGFAEIDYVIKKSPNQRKKAQAALLTIAAQDLSEYESIEDLQNAGEVVEFIPSEYSTYWRRKKTDLSDFRRRINDIADLAKDYQNRETLAGRLEAMKSLSEKMSAVGHSMAFTPETKIFRSPLEKWSKIVAREEEKITKELDATPIPNPYISGKPLNDSDKNRKVFTGRRDIIRAIEENIVNPQERNSLLLYGRRRIGKTSTLKNLQGFLSQYVTVYIDFQNAKWRDSDAAFCKNLIKEIASEFKKKRLLENNALNLQAEDFEKNTFTKFDEYLDFFEKEAARTKRKILLTFDEYEKLKSDFEGSNISHEVFNQLRNIVQHREQTVVLFSGSHRFEEMEKINWSDYLINTKTLELSFLTKEDSAKLLTEPVPKLIYEAGVKEKIIELTHCQPYLLQVFGSDLVNHLNAEMRFNATKEDLELIVEKVLVSADGYFHNTWSEEMSVEEQKIMRTLAAEGEQNSNDLPHQDALRKLIRKEVVKEMNGKCKLTIELFKLYLLKKGL